jgi:sodium-dependent dicarboxylate transporter 2/3/5
VGLQASGLSSAIVEMMPAGGGTAVALFAVLAMIMTTFMSNTATANLVIPIAVSMGGEFSVLAVTIALMSSTTMILPISTPPNAIAYGSGILRARDMIFPGLMIAIFGLVVILLLAPIYWRWIGVFG